ncbi:MAG: ABC transporter permease [Chitinophagales bacterium]
MFKLLASIRKDFRILIRDRVGLILMFAMPILLVIVITSVQNSTFELVNENKIALLIANQDTAAAAKDLTNAMEEMGMFRISYVSGKQADREIISRMHKRDAWVALIIPPKFSSSIISRAKNISQKALKDVVVQSDSAQPAAPSVDSITMYYHPVLQESFRRSVEGAISSAVQLVQSKEIVRNLYSTIHESKIDDTLEDMIVKNEIPIHTIPVSRDGNRNVPNSTQHNVPAWSIFAMFFIVISLAGSVVREKLNGSFIRLKTLPTSFMVALFSKQIAYLVLTLAQTIVIFSIGIWLFPLIGLPRLNLPADVLGLLVVTLICGCCAASYAICVGVFAETQVQANGFGAISVVILAAIGGLLVPSFAMPASFGTIMKISPLHWCLEAYYGLFLEGGKLKDILMNILSLLVITLLLQGISIAGLKHKKLI